MFVSSVHIKKILFFRKDAQKYWHKNLPTTWVAITCVHLCIFLLGCCEPFWHHKLSSEQVNLPHVRRWDERIGTFISFYLMLIDPCMLMSLLLLHRIVRNPRIIAVICFIKFFKHFWIIYYLFVCMWLNSDMLGADDSTFIKFYELESKEKRGNGFINLSRQVQFN